MITHKATCPHCKEVMTTDCEGCIKGNMLVHLHSDTEEGKEGIPDVYDDIKWEVCYG
jgi:hypothetical protein